MSNEIDHVDTDELVCPYCGFEHTDSWDLAREEGYTWWGRITCAGCGVRFGFVESSVYTTTKIEPEDKPDEPAN